MTDGAVEAGMDAEYDRLAAALGARDAGLLAELPLLVPTTAAGPQDAGRLRLLLERNTRLQESISGALALTGQALEQLAPPGRTEPRGSLFLDRSG